ncbi:TraR/DksA family transcriptional regulator [Rhodococcus sp. NPDC058521]|uniref:TraR/DksA family transcriptional regulator n=1 Tax=Rhodococcus sp. NPDC058521 TaxID=3346536 RepID=UPI0036625DE4
MTDSTTSDAHRRRIAEARDHTERRIAALTERFDAIVAGSEFTTDDDEHDPEGSTIAFERSQVQALLTDARRELEELDDAATRLANGSYGVCSECGRAIAAERLDALPTATKCIDCA